MILFFHQFLYSASDEKRNKIVTHYQEYIDSYEKQRLDDEKKLKECNEYLQRYENAQDKSLFSSQDYEENKKQKSLHDTHIKLVTQRVAYYKRVMDIALKNYDKVQSKK